MGRRMQNTSRFVVEPTWQVILKDVGIEAREVLIRARLPSDLFSRKNATLSAAEYFRLWDALDTTFGDESFPLQLGQSMSVESFSPPIFAALCSGNLNAAMTRLSQFKKLVGPMRLDIGISEDSTSLRVDCLYQEHPVPASLTATELVFLVHLVRIATREHVVPLAVSSNVHLVISDAYRGFFGIQPTAAATNLVVFSAADAKKPFLTHNEAMWQYFEPEFRQRLSQLHPEAGFSSRVKSALLELLPSGKHGVDDVATALNVSRRTLQRRLSNEATSFQEVLNTTREGLAKHYLAKSDYSGAQISFLLGFDDPNSFFRAFQNWTGTTPERLRANMAL